MGVMCYILQVLPTLKVGVKHPGGRDLEAILEFCLLKLCKENITVSKTYLIPALVTLTFGGRDKK